MGAGLLEAFSQPCECCNGRGVIITYDPEADGQAAHHVHARGAGNGGNGSRSAPATPAAIAARPRPSDIQPADSVATDSLPDGVNPDSGSVAAEAAQTSNGRGEPGRPAGSGNGRRRRRRPSATAAAAATADAPAAPTATEAPAAPTPEPQDGAA